MRSASRCRKFRYDILLTQVRSGGILEYGWSAPHRGPQRAAKEAVPHQQSC
jgi:hypothetical protein